MANNLGPFYAYKETRLDLDPATQGSIVNIRLPVPGASTWSTKSTQKRSQVADLPIAEDEDTFRKRQLATSASIYNRAHHKSPRSFLWRVVDGRKVLVIRVVDVSKPGNVPDTNLTLRFNFPDPIIPACIAFSDSREHDVLSTFVLTESNHLYTLNLRPDHFRRISSTEDTVNEWCKSYLPSAFSFKTVHRLVALSADELLLSFYDGGLFKLAKASGSEGAIWTERHYSEGGWSLRGMFQGSNTIRYGKGNIELSAATSVASPVTGIDRTPYAFTVCLDHRLRVWNLQSGKIAYTGDILNQDLEPQEHAKQVIQPSYSQLVKVYENNDENALCVTYSPLGTGQFKFWHVTPAGGGSLEVADLFPNNKLEPQMPTAELWTLADFAVVVDRSSVRSFRLWTLWKNNISYRVQKLEFQTGSIASIRAAWAEGWAALATETLLDAALPASLGSDPSDATDKWLEFILTPGRFSTPTIETGLAIYERGLGALKEANHRVDSLPERLCSSIASTASLGRTSDGNMDYEQFRSATDVQWRRFYRLLLELHGQRGEALSLVLDHDGDMPWVILADGVAALRESSSLERIWHNSRKIPVGTEHVARPLFAAAAFRESISDQFLHNCRTALLGEIFEEPSLTDPARMRVFYDKCDFANQIGDEEFAQLLAGLGGTFKDLTTSVYEALLALLNGSEESERRPHISPLAEYGNKLIVRSVQEIAELHRNICLDQLIVLVLVEAEINHGDEGIAFETATIFGQLLSILRRLELIHWLASTQITLPLSKLERSNSMTERTGGKKPGPITETITVLEGVLRHLFGLDLRSGETLPSAVTEVAVQICAPDSEYEAPPVVIQCFLLKHDRVDLAMEFARFGNHDAFSIYIQGRVSLAANDALTAAMYFKKAAFGMAYPDAAIRSDRRTAGYLDETEKALLNAGLPEYYSHIVALYDKERIYSYVIDFARLSLQFITGDSNSVNHAQLRTEMHSRLFNGAIQTAQYDLAHSTITSFKNSPLQRASLRTLVIKMCETSSANQLINLPFISLQDDVDEILAQKCHTIIDVNVGIPYHKILYAWRIKRNDFRGAASISMERLQRLQNSGDGDIITNDDGLETPVTKQYISLINALSCVDPKQAWILTEDIPKKSTNGAARPRRKVVTLAEIRKAYQGELDRIAAIQNNQFAFAGGDEDGDGDEMDIV